MSKIDRPTALSDEELDSIAGGTTFTVVFTTASGAGASVRGTFEHQDPDEPAPPDPGSVTIPDVGGPEIPDVSAGAPAEDDGSYENPPPTS